MGEKKKKCARCGKLFDLRQWNQIYCGSKSGKTGCSYKMHLERIKNFNLGKNREWMKAYQREWRKEQRRENSDYAKRQLEVKREYWLSKDGREVANAWRRKNIKKVLIWNRKRMLTKKGVVGSHTVEEWNNLRKKQNYSCAICGIVESQLKETWKDKKGFDSLTRDHIIPISKGGTDNINNIQALCIGCNAKKKDGEVHNG
jgi:5-methylcytosine-specific restriction endonuclease McrA